MASPTAVPPGSRVTCSRMPCPSSQAAAPSRHVVLPAPSIPSKVMKRPGFVTMSSLLVPGHSAVVIVEVGRELGSAIAPCDEVERLAVDGFQN